MEEFNSTLSAKYFRVYRLLMHGLHDGAAAAAWPTGGQGRVLKLLRLKPEMSQREMAEILGIRPQSLGETLSKLEAAGYVEREPMENDRRSLVVRLTESGAQAAESGRTQVKTTFSAAWTKAKELSWRPYWISWPPSLKPSS